MVEGETASRLEDARAAGDHDVEVRALVPEISRAEALRRRMASGRHGQPSSDDEGPPPGHPRAVDLHVIASA